MLIKDLAKIVEHDALYAAKWEIGIHRPSYEILMVLALFFDVTIDYLMGIEDEFGNKIKL
ncbi:MAG: helix-turn-helix domain-containing protein [Firmicutes bacterium]|nr:helix-turn-helix domain-containing protein [Bacillota bacterium]